MGHPDGYQGLHLRDGGGDMVLVASPGGAKK